MYTGHSVSVGGSGTEMVLDDDGQWKENDGRWSVSEFTGLQDKAGTDIYEGDVLKIRTPYRIIQTHHDPFCEEPLEPAIREEFHVVWFNKGCFVVGEPELGNLLCWELSDWNKEAAIEMFQSRTWEGEDGDLAYLLDWYKFDNENALIKSLGVEVIGNIYENPEII